VTRLRKYLKSRRITGISQIGTDRIIDFSFSDGAYHIFLEFFAGGNIILTDREYNILAFFRQVPAGVGQEEIKAGLKYTVSNKQNYDGVPDVTADRVLQTLEKAQALFAQEGNAPKKSKKKEANILRKALSQGFPEYPPLLLDHVFALKEFDTATPLDQVLGSQDLMRTVKEVLEEAQRISNTFDSGDSHPGYIVAKEDMRPIPEGETSAKAPGLLYEDFHPFKPRQFEDKPGIKILEFERFNATVDEYFSSLESQRLESRLTEREEAAKKKLESVRSEHKKQIDALKNAQELHIRKADAIHDNLYRVQEAMDAVNGLVAQGMDWGEIARLIEMEQDRGNPVAQIIKLPLKLYENTVTLLLGEAGDDEEEDEEFSSSDESDSDEENKAEEERGRAERESKLLTIDIDLGLSPWANASQYFDQKKLASEKAQRTAQSSTKALKSHEKKVTTDLKRGLKKEKQVLRQARVPFWFEKFIFFISSEGYLVIGYVTASNLVLQHILILIVREMLCKASCSTGVIWPRVISLFTLTWKVQRPSW
jgi:predicted ribosome quality control (RQC) complex YloA/Tae2 family protein